MLKSYSLPQLPYGYKDLEPYISEEQLTIHHQKHHRAYVNAVNAIFEKLEKARKESSDLDRKAVLKDLSFQMGGHILHSFFWDNLIPQKSSGKPSGGLLDAINAEFGDFEQFKKEFTQAAMSVEGSGWAALAYEMCGRRLVIMQIEKHNVNVIIALPILLVVDVFEHAYYLDYKNDRVKFLEAFWQIADWGAAAKRFEELLKAEGK